MKVGWSELAKRRLKEIGDFIKKENPKAASDVVMRIVNAGNALDIFPRRGREGVVDGTLEVGLSDIHYTIIYIVKGEGVLIATVVNQKQQFPLSVPDNEKTILELLQ